MKKGLLISSGIIAVMLSAIFVSPSSNASSSSPPNATAAAPADAGGQTCTACHGGSAISSTTGVIFTDIPSTGYVPNATYNVTVTLTGASAYGFQLTPQTPTSNAAIGTWIAGAGTTVSGKYIKQSPKKTGANAVWTFQWKAPATASTAVTFYGAFNYANNDSGQNGDVIKKSSETYTFSTMASLNSLVAQNDAGLVSVFPNPVTNLLHVNSTLIFTKGVIYSLDGKLVREINLSDLNNKVINVEDLNDGIYYLVISSENGNKVCKFIKE